MKLLKEFRELKPPEFTGNDEPKVASEWLARMEDIWWTLPVDKETKVTLIVGKLRESARTWWEMGIQDQAAGMT